MSARRFNGRGGFTLVEVMLAITIFAMVLASIYASWTAILRGTKAGLDAATSVQRCRVTVRAVEDALSSAQMFSGNPDHYWFIADTKGDFASLSLVARLPETFPGSGLYGEESLRHVEFEVVRQGDGRNELLLRQWPLLSETNNGDAAYTIVLGRDVDKFTLEFYDLQKKEWVEEWDYTNALPPLVKVAIGMGNGPNTPAQDRETFHRIVSIPSVVVPVEWQIPAQGPGGRVPPGFNPANPNNPNNPNVPNNPQDPRFNQPNQYPPNQYPPNQYPPNQYPPRTPFNQPFNNNQFNPRR
jgi:prepilin-type N-terminal cleavage/methylation domain-containing protein